MDLGFLYLNIAYKKTALEQIIQVCIAQNFH